MSHSAFFDALHAAQVRIGEQARDAAAEIARRGNFTAEYLYGADPSAVLTECHDCYGTNPCCPTCHGAGWWRG